MDWQAGLWPAGRLLHTPGIVPLSNLWTQSLIMDCVRHDVLISSGCVLFVVHEVPSIALNASEKPPNGVVCCS